MTGPAKILVQRAGAFGDVISTTPVLRRLREERGPNAIIHVDTDYPEIFEGNTDVTKAAPWHIHSQMHKLYKYTEIFDLNGSYERRKRAEHGIDCYMEDVFGDRKGDKSLKVIPKDLPWSLLDSEVINWKKAVVLHAATSWPNRTMPDVFWQGVADEINKAGYQVIVTGTERDRAPNGTFDMRAQLSPCQQADLIRRARVFIGSDCGGLFLAGATDTPIVGLFTISPASNNIIWRHGEANWKMKALVPDLPCVGCTVRAAEKAWPHLLTYHGCEREDFACVKSFDAHTVAMMALDLAEGG